MSTSTITTATYCPSKRVETSTILKSAFQADPVLRYMIKDDAEYEKLGSEVFSKTLYVYATSFGMTDIVQDSQAGVTSCAIWQPAKPTVMGMLRNLVFLLSMFWIFGIKKTWSWILVAIEFEKKRHHHAPTAHHLHVLGTGQEFQNKSMGSHCIKRGLERADREGAPCYLESTNEKNFPFYERFGFKTVETFNIDNGKGPIVRLMVRECKKKN